MKPFKDKLHNGPEKNPFSRPPSARETSSTQLVLLAMLAAAVVYGIYQWALQQQINTGKTQPTAQAAGAQKARQTSPDITRPVLPPIAPSNRSLVSKCIANGQTSYSDQGCPQGAIARLLLPNPEGNLIAGLRPSQLDVPNRPQDQAPLASRLIAPGNVVSSTADECKLIDAEIARLDALARQPQSGQAQDWITQKRKELRDRQFRIRC